MESEIPADLDGYGDLDVIVRNARFESEITVWQGATLWINAGEGKFSPSSQELPGASAAPGDFDRDGDVDIIVLDGSWLALILNQGGAQEGEAGAFKRYGNPIRPPDRENWPSGSVVSGDLDNDGKLDAFVASCCGYVSGQASGETEAQPSFSWAWIQEWESGWLHRRTVSFRELGDLPMRAAALGDLDDDGDLDVFAALTTPKTDWGSGPADQVLLNDGLGNFRDSGQRLGESESTAAALGDLDGDGDLDALVGTPDGAVVWINAGGVQGGEPGAFAPGQEIAGLAARAVFLADLDGDGDPDALIAGARQAGLWWNDGQGAFTHSNQRFHYSERHALGIGDFDGDGDPDIFAGAYAEAHRVWFNREGRFR